MRMPFNVFFLIGAWSGYVFDFVSLMIFTSMLLTLILAEISSTNKLDKKKKKPDV